MVYAHIQAIDLVQHGHLDQGNLVLYRDECSAHDTNYPHNNSLTVILFADAFPGLSTQSPLACQKNGGAGPLMRCKCEATVLDVQGAQQPPLLELYSQSGTAQRLTACRILLNRSRGS